jgi:hypothetical protein
MGDIHEDVRKLLEEAREAQRKVLRETLPEKWVRVAMGDDVIPDEGIVRAIVREEVDKAIGAQEAAKLPYDRLTPIQKAYYDGYDEGFAAHARVLSRAEEERQRGITDMKPGNSEGLIKKGPGPTLSGHEPIKADPEWLSPENRAFYGLAPEPGLYFEQILPGLREGKKYRAEGWREKNHIGLIDIAVFCRVREPGADQDGYWCKLKLEGDLLLKPVWHEYHDKSQPY